MRILCAADVHVGRCSSLVRDPGGQIIADFTADFSALGAWERLVEVAIAGHADAVVIAGDFYDSLPAQYESRPRVRKTFERLRDRGIPALAVAGNHDHHALRAFAESHKGLLHLFSESRWEAHDVAGIRFVGRSFGRETERESLLGNFDLPPAGITIGLIHADINAQSPYSPTPVELFRGKGVAGWVVGHVHAPRRYENETVVYPGSPQALDWGETGSHGCCWLEIKNGQVRFLPVLPLSTVEYHPVEIELFPGDRLEAKVSEMARHRRLQHGGLLSVQFRVALRLCGGANPSDLADIGVDVPFNESDWYRLDSTVVVPQLDLKAEANQKDARGQAARLLLGLGGAGDPDWQRAALDLVERVETEINAERGKLDLPAREEMDFLRQGKPGEARQAVQRMLERILTAEDGAQ
jgi:DNA repair exonuclease SbcCD nuclease subunit